MLPIIVQAFVLIIAHKSSDFMFKNNNYETCFTT
jgi:hypothetical protein